MARPTYDFGPRRRRHSPIGLLLLLLLVLFLGFLAWLGFSTNEEPLQRIEEDVTNAIPAR